MRDLIKLGPEIVLDRQVLDDCFYEQVSVGQFLQIGDEAKIPQSFVALRFGHLSALDAFGERLFDRLSGLQAERVRHLAHRRRESSRSRDLGDSASHQASAKDGDLSDLLHRSAPRLVRLRSNLSSRQARPRRNHAEKPGSFELAVLESVEDLLERELYAGEHVAV